MTAQGLDLRPLLPADLPAAAALCAAALPLDGVAPVIEEKLLGDNGPRPGLTLLAHDRGGAPLGLLSLAGRYIKLLCVDPAARRRGVASALLDAARGLRPPGSRLRASDHPGNYLSPGCDARYPDAAAFFAARGFAEVAQIDNLRAPVRDNPLVTPARSAALDEAVRGRGYAVRRVLPGTDDAAQVLQLATREFSPIWALELRRALGTGPADPLPPGVHAVFVDGDAVAFAAHDGNNRGLGWFGPMGTLPAHRGQGLGETLLIRCLLDVQDRPEGGVIAWVGPVDFYRRACGAVHDRHFLVYEER